MIRKYKITVSKNIAPRYRKGVGKLVCGYTGEPNAPHGYLWLGDENEDCIGWIDERQMDAITKAWLKLRSAKGKKK